MTGQVRKKTGEKEKEETRRNKKQGRNEEMG